MDCAVCKHELELGWNHCPNCGSPIHASGSRRLLQVHRETAQKVEQHLTFEQINHEHYHLDLGDLFKPAPAVKVSIPAWVYVACVASVLLVPVVRSWIAMGIESQVLLYAGYRCSTDRQKLWSVLALIIIWAACLFIWPPVGF